MLTTDREKNICKKYGARDPEGKVHCLECPLNYSDDEGIKCKATCHFSKRTHKWELDSRREHKKCEIEHVGNANGTTNKKEAEVLVFV